MKHLIFIAFVALVLTPSCKKDNSIQPASKKILTGIEYQYSSDTSYAYFTYDQQGRVLTGSDGEDTSTFQYNGNEVTIVEWDSVENREVFSFKGTLNANGLLAGGNATSKYSPNYVYQQQHQYEYDANGYMTKASIQRDNNTNFEYRFSYTNGNLTQMDSYNKDGLTNTYLYEYNGNNPVKTNIVWLNYFLPANTITGKNSAQNPTKITRKRTNAPDEVTTYAYTLDADGYVVRQNVQLPDGTTYNVLYHYE